MSRIKFTPLGGVGEIGRNCFCYSDPIPVLKENNEYVKESIVIDAGELVVRDKRGIDVLPNTEIIKKFREDGTIKGIFITHGHLDHGSGAPLISIEFCLPVLISHTALHFIVQQCRYRAFQKVDARISKSVDRHSEYFQHEVRKQLVDELPINLRHREGFDESKHCIREGMKFQFGNFKVTPIKVNHSIEDTFGFLMEGNGLRILHLPDHKMAGFTHAERKEFEDRLRGIAYPRIDLLVMEALNSGIPGFTPFEQEVIDSLEDELRNLVNKNRIFIPFFSSNTRRFKKLYELVLKVNKGEPPAFLGSSMRHSAKFLKLEYTPFKKAKFIFCTGSQAEEGSALKRLIENRTIGEGDAIISSSRSIPENEKYLREMYQDLDKLGVYIILHEGEIEKLGLKDCNNIQEEFTHVSGHGYQEDKKLVLNITHPKIVVPYHAGKEEVEIFKTLVPRGTECRIIPNNETLEI